MSVIAFSSRHVDPEPGVDGCPNVTWRFTHMVLPIVEMADKEGASVHQKVTELFEIYKVSFDEFYSVTSDVGVEITGNSREAGDGEKGLLVCQGIQGTRCYQDMVREALHPIALW